MASWPKNLRVLFVQPVADVVVGAEDGTVTKSGDTVDAGLPVSFGLGLLQQQKDDGG